MQEAHGLQRFIAELKRRRVFRVMALYGVVGFVLLQVVDLAVPALLLPEWTYRLVAFLLLIGFPIAILFSWAFERTDRGLQRTGGAGPGEVARLAGTAGAQRRSMAMAAGGTALLLIGAWWVFDGRSAGPQATLDLDAPVESIAVLPFADMSPEGDQEYFGDGLAEELLDALAKVDGLVVAARTSSFRFRGAEVDIAEVADRLGVQTVLEGSVRSGGGRVRITAQLVNADGFHLWSERYDRSIGEMRDLIRVQEEIAQSIVAALALAPDTAAGEALETLVAQGTDNLEAYNALLRGRHLMAQRSPQSMAAAAEQLERAIELDPDYARAWANLGMTTTMLIAYTGGDSAIDARGKESVERALELDPMLAEAHASSGYRSWVVDRDFESADQSFARAIELDPRLSTAWKWRGELLAGLGGDPDAGVPYSEKAVELDPLSLIALRDLAKVYDAAGRYAEADSVMASLLELEPDFPPAIMDLAVRAQRAGDLAAAIEGWKHYEDLAGFPQAADLTHLNWLARDYEEAVRQFRRAVPSDTASIEGMLLLMRQYLHSLNEVGGPRAVKAFVDARSPAVAQVDTVVAIFMEGYASAVSGDEEAARAAMERLPTVSRRAYRISLAGALGDREAILELLPSIVEDSYSPYLRFLWEHAPTLDPVRDDPRFQVLLDSLPPYTASRW